MGEKRMSEYKIEMKLQHYLKSVAKEKEWARLGVSFKTKDCYYWYDLGTGKVLQWDYVSTFEILENICNSNGFERMVNLKLDEQGYKQAYEELKESIEKEHILQAVQVKSLSGIQKNPQLIKDYISNEISSLI